MEEVEATAAVVVAMEVDKAKKEPLVFCIYDYFLVIIPILF